MTTDPYFTSPHVRSGDLSAAFLGGPRRVAWQRRQVNDPSPAMVNGTALHHAILEPAVFADRYAVKPEGLSLATKDGKEWKAANEGKTIITADTAARGLAMAPAFAALVGPGGVAESVVAATDDGIPVACKPDWLRVTDDLIDYVSLKSSRHATPQQYAAQYFTTDRYAGYDLAEAHYLSVLRLAFPSRPIRMRQVVVPTDGPCDLCVIEIDPVSLDRVDGLRRRLTAEAWDGLQLTDEAIAAPAAYVWTLAEPRWAVEVPE